MSEIKENLRKHLEAHPQATEEDVVKFVFQAFLGVGHLVSSADAIQRRLENEMAQNPADDTEPQAEELSPRWVRLNLRPAKARGIAPEELAKRVYRSAQQPIPYTRQDVIDFCKALDLPDMDKDKIEEEVNELLKGSFLPSHSQQYREAYKPAYVVLLREEIP
ncbi:hypothetical protein JNO48_10590 [Clostridiales bacterium]|nr:hypothetical protein JNO48_10590 [Clostridiales bacterium]